MTTKILAATAAVCIAWTGALLGAVTVRAASPVETVLVLTPVVHGYETTTKERESHARASNQETANGVRPAQPDPRRDGRAQATVGGLELAASVSSLASVHVNVKHLSVYETAPHTHAGLVAWLGTLRWPWGPIGTCESVHDDSWRESSISYARGIFQFLPSTWASLGLFGDPAAASWRDQLKAAIRLRARDGLRQSWVCARILGIA